MQCQLGFLVWFGLTVRGVIVNTWRVVERGRKRREETRMKKRVRTLCFPICISDRLDYPRSHAAPVCYFWY